MIQSDALSRRPDFYLDSDDDNENMILLPDNLFVNLIDLELQDRIASSSTYDSTAAEAIKLLLADGLTEAQSDLSDWTVDHVDGKPILFIATNAMYRRISKFVGKLLHDITMFLLPAIPGSSKHTMLYESITGGLVCIPSLRTT
jgi:hypothetical protein